MYKFDTTWIAIATGMLFSLMVSGAINEAQRETALESFTAEVYQQAAALGREFDLNAESLYVLKGLFEGSESVTAEEFRRTASDSIARHRDIIALAWVPRVTADQVDDYVTQRRSELPEFDLIQMQDGDAYRVTERDVYYPIFYGEPMTGNAQLLGLDLGNEPAVLKIIERAGVGGLLTTTSSLNFLKPNYPTGTILMVLPIYRGMPLTLEARRAQFAGVVVALMSISAMVHESLGVNAHTWVHDTLIIDKSEAGEANVLYQTGETPKKYVVERTLHQVGGSQWVIHASPVTGLLSGLQQLVSVSIGLVGILLFLALGFLHSGAQNRNRIITARVRERTRELNEANEQLARLSSTDQLTGVDNRRELDRHLHEEWQRMAREKQPLSLMMIDVDMFKAYNDNYGHQAGDLCLVNVVTALQGQLKRAADRIARYGGEEFVIILSNTGEEATVLAEACRVAVEKANLPHAFSPVSDRVTISVGLATTIPDLAVSPDLLIAAADNAMYQAKQQGRNRVVKAGKISR